MGWGSFFSAPFKAVKKVVSWVGDAVADVVEFVVEDILEPVVEVVGGIVQGMIDDPLTTLATAAALVTGQAWAIPLIQGASTAIQGGSIKDVVIAMGASYAGARIGAAAGKYAGEALGEVAGEAGASIATQQVVANISQQAVQQATAGAIRAVAMGGDLEDIGKAAFSGALMGGVTAGASEFGSYIGESVLPSDAVTGVDAESAMGFNVDLDTYNTFTETSNAIGSELTALASGWDKLPDTVQAVIKDGAAASISSLIQYGEIDEQQVAGAVARAVMTANITAETLDKIPGVSNEAGAVISKIAGDVVASAYTDADPYTVYQTSLGAYGLGELHKEVDKLQLYIKLDDLTRGNIGRAIDAISGAGAVFNEKLDAVNLQTKLAEDARTAYNNKVEEAKAAIAKYKNDVNHYNDTLRHGDKGTADKFKADNIDSFTTETYPKLQEDIANLKIGYESANSGVQTASDEYIIARDDLVSQQKYLEKEVVAPVQEEFTKQVVTAIKPDFDPDFVEVTYLGRPSERPMGFDERDVAEGEEAYRYAEAVEEGFEVPEGYDRNPYNFWLDTGRRLATSQEEYDKKVDQFIIQSTAPDLLEHMSDYTGQYSDLSDYDALREHVKEKIGPDLVRLQTDWDGVDGEQLVKAYAQEWLDAQAPVMLPALDLYDPATSIEPAELPPRRRLIPLGPNTTPADVIEGRAKFVLKPNKETGALEGKWTTEGEEIFLPAVNGKVIVDTKKLSEPYRIQELAEDIRDAFGISEAAAADKLDEIEIVKPNWTYESEEGWKRMQQSMPSSTYAIKFYRDIEPADREYLQKEGFVYDENTNIWERPPRKRELLEEGYFFNPNNNSYEKWVGEVGQKTLESIPADSLAKGRVQLLNLETKEPIEGFTNGVQNPDGSVTFEDIVVVGERIPSRISYVPIPEPLTISELPDITPILTYETIIDNAGKVQEGEFNIDAEVWKDLTAFSKMILTASMNTKDILDYVSEREDQFRELDWVPDREPGQSTTDAWKKNFSSVIYAIGDQTATFHGLVSMLGRDAREGEITKFGHALMEIATANNPPEYNAATKRFYEAFGEAEGFWEKTEQIRLALADDEGRSVILRGLIFNELLQEVPLFVVTGGAFQAVKWGTRIGLEAKAGVELVKTGAELAGAASKELIEAAATKWGLKAAVGTNVVLNMAETAGGVAVEYWSKFKEAALKSGMTEEAAIHYATVKSTLHGFLGAGIEGTLGRLGIPADKFIKAFAGKGRLGGLLGAFKSAVMEAGSEGIEAASTTAAAIKALYDLDPSIIEEGGEFERWKDIILSAGMLEAVAGGGAGAGASAAAQIGREFQTIAESRESDPDPDFDPPLGFDINDVEQSAIARIQQNWEETQAGGAGMDFPTSPSSAEDVMAELLGKYNPTVFKGLRDARSGDPDIKEQGVEDIKTAFGWEDLPSIDMVQNEEGVYVPTDPDTYQTYGTALAVLDRADPDEYVTFSNARNAYRNNTAGIPYEYNEQEILAVTGETPAADLPAIVDQDIDDKSTTYDEVQEAAAEEGYVDISPEDAEPFIGQGEAGFDESTKTAVTEWAAPRVVTPDKLITYLESLTDPVTGEPTPFEATQEELDRFVGQGGPTFEQDILAQLPDYVTPRQVTPRNIREIHEQEGTPAPTQDEIDRYTGQGGPEFRSEREAEIQAEQDLLAVIPEEVENIYREMGLDAPITAKDAERLAGQYPEAELEGRATEFLPIATANSIAAILGKRGQEVTQADVTFVADLVAQQEVLTEAGTALQPLTSQQLAYDVTGDNVIDINDQIMLEQVRTGAISQAAIAPQSAFAAQEGIASQIQQQTAIQTAIQNQIAQQTAADEERRRMQAQNQYLAQVMETTPVEVKTPPPAEIKYVYDPFGESIFATPEQESLFGGLSPFPSPTATAPTGSAPFTLPMQTVSGGGIIEDKTDEILRALGENR